MVCLKCGCDTWFEFKNNMKITTSENCSCECHKCDENHGILTLISKILTKISKRS